MSSSNPQRRRERRDAMRGQRRERLRRQQQIQRRNRMLAALGGVVVIAIIAALSFVIITNNQHKDNGNGNLPPVVAIADPYAGIPQQPKILGDPNAMRLVEYGDYQCSVCEATQKNVIPTIIQKYVATGALAFEFRDRLVIDSTLAQQNGPGYDHESLRAAEAALCAGDQGAYWPYHASLYANWTGEGVGDFSESRVKDLAGKLNLDTATFNTCLDSKKYEDQVKAEDSQAASDGVNGTPTFMLNGQQIKGSSSDPSSYTGQIDQILAAAGVTVPAPGATTPVPAAETPVPAGIGTPLATPIAVRPDDLRY